MEKEATVSVDSQQLGLHISEFQHSTIPDNIQHPVIEAGIITHHHSIVNQVADDHFVPLGLECAENLQDQQSQNPNNDEACKRLAAAQVPQEDIQQKLDKSEQGDVCFERLPFQSGMQQCYVFNPIQNKWEVKSGIPDWCGTRAHRLHNAPNCVRGVEEHQLGSRTFNRGSCSEFTAQCPSKESTNDAKHGARHIEEGLQNLQNTRTLRKEPIGPQHSASFPHIDVKQPVILCPLNNQCSGLRSSQGHATFPQKACSGCETTEHHAVEIETQMKPPDYAVVKHGNHQTHNGANQQFNSPPIPIYSTQYRPEFILGGVNQVAVLPSFIQQSGQEKYGHGPIEQPGKQGPQQGEMHAHHQFERQQEREEFFKEMGPHKCCNYKAVDVGTQACDHEVQKHRQRDFQQNNQYEGETWGIHNSHSGNCRAAAMDYSHIQTQLKPAISIPVCTIPEDLSTSPRKSSLSVRRIYVCQSHVVYFVGDRI